MGWMPAISFPSSFSQRSKGVDCGHDSSPDCTSATTATTAGKSATGVHAKRQGNNPGIELAKPAGQEDVGLKFNATKIKPNRDLNQDPSSSKTIPPKQDSLPDGVDRPTKSHSFLDYQFYHHQNHYHVLSAITYTTTLGASLAAAGITYPAEQYRIEWEQSALKEWNFTAESTQLRRNPILTPLVRIWTNHVASNFLCDCITPLQPKDHPNHVQTQLISGTLAGVAQMALLLPLQVYESQWQHYLARRRTADWTSQLEMHLFQGGSWDPQERRQRVWRSIGLQATREVLYNVTFFPLFSCLIQTQNQFWQNHNSLPILLSSGMVAGTISALLVIPLDLAHTFYRHSRQQWHWWRGIHVRSPPWALLSRGVLLHATCLGGPSFGVVAAIYEYPTAVSSTTTTID